MSTGSAWVERTFDFSRGGGSWDELREKLAGAPERLAELVAGLGSAELTRRTGDSWSIQEHAGHLWDLESLHRGRLRDYWAGRAELRPADLTNRKTHEAQHDQGPIDSILEDFRFEREVLIEDMEAMGPERRERRALHPRLGISMTVTDYARFVVEHDEHHFRRIREMK